MKVLIKNFHSSGAAGGLRKQSDALDESYILRQQRIIYMYSMLISLYKLSTARKLMIVKEK